jgi:hypothetical protein
MGREEWYRYSGSIDCSGYASALCSDGCELWTGREDPHEAFCYVFVFRVSSPPPPSIFPGTLSGYAEDEGSRFLRNIGTHLPNYMETYPRTRAWEPQSSELRSPSPLAVHILALYILRTDIFVLGSINTRSRDSSVGIATSYGIEGLGSISSRGNRFFFSSHSPDRLWGPPILVSTGYWGLFPWR